jgi:hypothetical protein
MAIETKNRHGSAPGSSRAICEEARAFISRALDDGVRTELLDIRDAGEHRLVLILHAHVPADYPTVENALTAVRLAP